MLDGVSADVVQQGDDDRLRVLSRGGLDVGPSELELEKHKGTETVKSTGGISNNQNSTRREKIIKGIIKTMTNTLKIILQNYKTHSQNNDNIIRK